MITTLLELKLVACALVAVTLPVKLPVTLVAVTLPVRLPTTSPTKCPDRLVAVTLPLTSPTTLPMTVPIKLALNVGLATLLLNVIPGLIVTNPGNGGFGVNVGSALNVAYVKLPNCTFTILWNVPLIAASSTVIGIVPLIPCCFV